MKNFAGLRSQRQPFAIDFNNHHPGDPGEPFAARVNELRPKADATVQAMVAPLVAQEVQNRVGRVAILARDLAAAEEIIRKRGQAHENHPRPNWHR